VKGKKMRKKQTGKWMIVVLCLLLWALPMCAAAEDLVLAGLDDAAGSSSSSGAGTSAETEAGAPTIWDAIPVTTDVSGDWRMILVNRANLLPDGFQVDLAVVPYVNDPNTLFDARAVDELNQMLLDCAAQGYYPIVRAAYRDRLLRHLRRLCMDIFIVSVNHHVYSRAGAVPAFPSISIPQNKEAHA
jgi:hypothetical protein